MEALRSLIAQCSGWPGVFILHSLLNKRGGNPSTYPGYLCDVSYPEPGVIRFTFSSMGASAWFDSVIAREQFRR